MFVGKPQAGGKARSRAHSAGLLDGREMGFVLLAKTECEGEAQECACQVWAPQALDDG